MIEKFSVKNFKCYKSLTVNDMKRFNFIVGDNGSGKSAFFDALFLCAGLSPELYLRTVGWRGGISSSGLLALSTDNYKSFFQEIFHSFKVDSDVEFEFVDSNSELRWLKISFGGEEEISIPIVTRDADSDLEISTVTPMLFKGGIGKKQTYQTSLEITGNKVIFKKYENPYSLAYLNSVNIFSPELMVKSYSELVVRNKEGVIKESVQNIFPEVVDIASIYQGGTEVIGLAIEHLPNKIHVGSYSAGLSKFIHIMIAIGNKPDKVVLIDEIDNGLYYKKMDAYMREIVNYCVKNNTQLFASTHSIEFLRGLLPLMKGRDDYCLLRAEKEGNESTLKQFPLDKFEAALELGAEIR